MTVSFWQRAEERMQSRVRGAGNVPCAVLTKGSMGSDPDAAISREQKAPDRISLPHGARRYSATSRVLPIKSTEIGPESSDNEAGALISCGFPHRLLGWHPSHSFCKIFLIER